MSNVRASSPGPTPSGHRRHRSDRHAEQGTEVPSITNAPERLAQDQARRTRQYLIQMGVRLVFFAAAVVIFMTDLAPRWVMWTLIVCAAVLPYSAVLFANAGRDRATYDTSPVTDRPRTELPPATAPSDPGVVVDDTGHTVIEHEDEPQDSTRDDGQDDTHDTEER